MNTDKVRLVTDPIQIEEVRKARAAAERRRAFWARHRMRLQELYPDEWVAVGTDGAVVAHSPDPLYVWGFLDRRELGPGDVEVEYMDTGSRRIVL